jgi:phospholipase/lecithinase/hemolysin
MPHPFTSFGLVLLTALSALHAPVAMASSVVQPYDQILVFGDSNADVGRRLALEGIPASPYFQGRHSNGPLAVEYLAAALGQSLVATGPQATDFAVGGALSGTGNVDTSRNNVLAATGLLDQVQSFADQNLHAGVDADANALYFIWSGANDLSQCGGAVCNLSQLNAITGNINQTVVKLKSMGAQHFMLVNNYGSNAGSQSFNALLTSAAQGLKAAGTDIALFDAASVVAQMRATGNPYGFTITSAGSPCYTGNLAGTAGTTCTNPQDHVTWDPNGHLTAHAQQVLGQAMVQAAGISPVPEPRGLALLTGGLMAVWWSARRRGRHLALAAALASAGMAQATVYTNKADFLAAVAVSQTIDFNHLIGTSTYPQNYPAGAGYQPSSGTSIPVGAMDFLGKTNGMNDTYLLGPDVGPGRYSLDGTPDILLGRNEGAIVGLTPTQAIGKAIGFDIGLEAALSGSVQIVVFANGGGQTVLPLTGNSGFFGYVGEPIFAITFTNLSPNLPGNSLKPYVVLDNVLLATPVPEPSGLALLPMGLAALLSLRKAARGRPDHQGC